MRLLSATDRVGLVGEARPLTVRPGDTVVRAGEQGRVALVLEGLLRLVANSREGRQLTLHHYRRGELAGLLGFTAPSVPYTLQAAVPSSLLPISTAALEEVVHRNPTLGWALAAQVNRLSQDLLARFVFYAFQPLRQRVAAYLLELSDLEGIAADRPVVRVSHQDLANAVGAPRESVSRALGEFRRMGAVHTGASRIEIRDRCLLAQAAGEADEPPATPVLAEVGGGAGGDCNNSH